MDISEPVPIYSSYMVLNEERNDNTPNSFSNIVSNIIIKLYYEKRQNDEYRQH